jgi:hypothetical protein
MARYEGHQLIQNLAKVPGLLDRLTSESQVVFDGYGLTEQERQAALARAGNADIIVRGGNADLPKASK